MTARRLLKSSMVYTASDVLQKGTALLLIPLYTRYLGSDGYGVLAVVAALNGFLAILFTLSLQAAVARYYFEYQDHPEKLRVFWGTQITFILIVTVVAGGVLLVVGNSLLAPLVGKVSYSPYIVIGVLTAMAQPLFQVLLAILQIREQAPLYAILNLINFSINVILAVAFVALLGWGVIGPLMAALATAVIFLGVSIWFIRRDVQFGINRECLAVGLRYSLPLVPHAIAGTLVAMGDRLLINGIAGTSSAGIYAVAFQLAVPVLLLTDSMNRAYVPIAMRALKAGDRPLLDKLPGIALYMVAAYCAAALTLSAFSQEIVSAIATTSFLPASGVLPLIAFAFVLNGVYYIYVNIMFFQPGATRLIPLGTLVGGIASVALNVVLIKRYDLTGAALAMLFAQCLTVIFVARIAYRLEPVRWPTTRFAVLVGTGLFFALIAQAANGLSFVQALLTKCFVVLVGLFTFFGLAGGSARRVREALWALRSA